MNRIDEDIKNEKFSPIYLLYGEEEYLIRQYRDKLKAALLGDADSMNLSGFHGKDASIEEVIGMSETLPFFANRRVIVLENTGLLKSGGEELADYLKTKPDTTFFIFVEQNMDKRSRLYKEITAQGTAVEFPRLKEDKLKLWISKKIKADNKQISIQAYNLFLEWTGDDMENISRELEKLCCYCMNRNTIEVDDVRQICTRRLQDCIFQMLDAMTKGNAKEAMGYYEDLLTQKESPSRILYHIGRQFHLLLTAKEMKVKGYPKQLIAEKMGLKPYIAEKYMVKSNSFSTVLLKQAIRDCVQTEYEVKTGRLSDRIGVELIIVQYSQKRGKEVG